jgi:predicted phosphodiesterase
VEEERMRIAVVSDIHGNLTAFEAALKDIRSLSPDLVFHGGDLADAGSSPIEIIDHIRALGWRGVMGNTDEMLVRPEALESFASQSTAPPAIWSAIREIAAATRAKLGEERLSWIRLLPMAIADNDVAIVHATPESCWRVPLPNSTDADLEAAYAPLGKPIVVFGHTHIPSVRPMSARTKMLINTGSVGLSYDGDPRASYLILDNGSPSIRRVEYDVEAELKALSACGLPGAEWTARMLRSSSPQMP